jgi:hypothetical protein
MRCLAIAAITLLLATGCGQQEAAVSCGKLQVVTLLKAILGLVPIVQGNVEVVSGTVNRRQGRVAYVPQVASVNWRFPQVIGWAAVQGILAAIAGIYGSYYLNLPAGPAIVLVNTAIFGAVLLFAPRSRRLGH